METEENTYFTSYIFTSDLLLLEILCKSHDTIRNHHVNCQALSGTMPSQTSFFLFRLSAQECNRGGRGEAERGAMLSVQYVDCEVIMRSEWGGGVYSQCTSYEGKGEGSNMEVIAGD